MPVFFGSTVSLTSALDGVAGEFHSPATLPPGRRPRTLCTWSWVGPQGQSEWVQKISCPPGIDPWTVQSTVSHCTDYKIPAHIFSHIKLEYLNLSVTPFWGLHNTVYIYCVWLWQGKQPSSGKEWVLFLIRNSNLNCFHFSKMPV